MYIHKENNDTYLNELRSLYTTIKNTKTPTNHTNLVQKNSNVYYFTGTNENIDHIN